MRRPAGVRQHEPRLPGGRRFSGVSGRVHLPSGLVTFLFTDIEGSTRLAQMLGAGLPAGAHRAPAAPARAPSSAQRRRRAVHRGRLVLRRVRRRRRRARRLRRPPSARWPTTTGRPPRPTPRVRMGLHTGHAEPLAGEYASPEVHRAARIAAAAHGGQVLCSAATAHHAAPLPAEALPARPRPAPAARLRRPGAPLPARRARPGARSSRARARSTRPRTTCRPRSTSFVGRQTERAELGALLARPPAGDGRRRGRRGQDPARRRGGRRRSSSRTRTGSGSSTSPR